MEELGTAIGLQRLISNFPSSPLGIRPPSVPLNPISNDPISPGAIPSSLSNILGGIGGASQLGGGALQIAEGHPLRGSIQAASGALNLADALGAGIGERIPGIGVGLAAANIASGLAAGGEQGDRQAIRALVELVFPAAAAVFSATDLINGLLGESDKGISKRIMDAKQQALQRGATFATLNALDKAQNFTGVIDVLQHLPAGTGQVQYGVGPEYTGETQIGTSQLTTTPGWTQTLAQATQDPLNFIRNFWAQTGKGGATSFDSAMTRTAQLDMLKALPQTPEIVQFTDLLRNTEPVDPRNTQAFQRALTEAQTWQSLGARGLSPYQRRILTQQYQSGLANFQQTQDSGLMAGLRGQANVLGLPIPALLEPSTVQQALMLGIPLPQQSPVFGGADPNAFIGGGA